MRKQKLEVGNVVISSENRCSELVDNGTGDMNRRKELTEKMKKKLKFVKNYGEQDFEIDKEAILSSEVVSFYWMLRKNGTVLVPSYLIDKNEEESERSRASAIDTMEFYLETEDALEIYRGDGTRGELKRISKEEMKKRLREARRYLIEQ